MANSSLNQYDIVPSKPQKGQEKEQAQNLIYSKPVLAFVRTVPSIEEIDIPYKDVILSLPRAEGWINGILRKYEDFWRPEHVLPGIICFQNSFKPRLDDIFITSFPKCGTTWIKAIIFAIINRKRFDFISHPLLKHNPHDCVKSVDFIPCEELDAYLESLPSPRALGSHNPYSVLPNSVKESKCKIVHICRDPKDALVSMWHMANGLKGKEGSSLPFSQAFEWFCKGQSPSGPIWQHILEYWSESLRNPDKVLFLKYEDLLENPLLWVKKIADFLGYSFSEEEETMGIPEKIVELCSFKSLKSLDVNKKRDGEITNSSEINHVYFRKGGIGDWRSHMSLEMAERLNAITREKFGGFGLSFPSSNINVVTHTITI